MGLVAVVRRGDEAHILRFGSWAVTVLELKQGLAERTGMPSSFQRVAFGCEELADALVLEASPTSAGVIELECLYRGVGGKGGFGAMLRSARGGIDSKKTTNFDAMRDLSGRRMRHVNNEAKLKEWLEAAPEREREAKMARQAEKELARARARPSFVDSKFSSSIESVRESVEAGVAVGIRAAKKKRQRENVAEAKSTQNTADDGTADAGAQEAAVDSTSAGAPDAPAESVAKHPTLSAAVLSPPSAAAAARPAEQAGPLEWMHCKNADDMLQECGAEAVKLELARLGLKCGGTPVQRAERLWLTKGKQLHELDPRLFAKKRKR